MSATSPIESIIRVDPDSYVQYNPVDAATAYLVKNNLAHLVDESVQTRVNWVTGITGNTAWVLVGADTRIYPYTFPWTWLSQSKPANVDLFVKASAAGGLTIDVRARIIPASYALGDTTAPSLLDVSGSVVSSGTVLDVQQVVAEQIPGLWSASKNIDLALTDGEDVGGTSTAILSLMRLELFVNMESATDEIGGLIQVFVREYE